MLVRLFLAIDTPKLRKAIRHEISREDVIVEIPAANGVSLWSQATRRICDVLMIRYRAVPEPRLPALETLVETPDAPLLVILFDDGDEVSPAELVAAGCRAALSSSVEPSRLADVLETIVIERAEAVRQRLATRRILEQPRLADFVSRSPVMQAFVGMVHRVVNTDVSLLLLGETGVGKERLAQAIHSESPRSGGPFVAVNCGALPETLLESELFGHERGAFTGAATSRRGCFEMAHGGTIFLDEIGELPLHLQVKLLRVLQEREVRRLGGEKPIKVDVRIMAATNRALKAEVTAQSFRSDLYYRLSVMTLTIPPLRERSEDIPELIDNYIEYLRPRVGSGVYGVRSEARDALVRYAWPGNVRELVNVIERGMILCPDEEIRLNDLPDGVARSADTVPDALSSDLGADPARWLDRPWREVRREVVERAERAYLAGLLEQTGGRIGETSRRAGMRERSLFDKMRYYNLRKEDYRS